MPDFSFWELSIALLVALVCIGPKRLPEVASALGGWVGRMRAYARHFQQEISSQMKDYEEVEEQLRESRRSIGEIHHSIHESPPPR